VSHQSIYPAVESAQFRQCAGQFATGIAVVSCLDDAGKPHGMTINSFTTVSLRPPTVLVSLMPGRTQTLIRKRGWYGVSLLSSEQQACSLHFSGKPQLGEEPLFEMKGQVPILSDTLAWFTCVVESMVVVHDHTLFIASVTDCSLAGGEPLLFYASRYQTSAMTV